MGGTMVESVLLNHSRECSGKEQSMDSQLEAADYTENGRVSGKPPESNGHTAAATGRRYVFR